jgi:hypothetical protein
VVLILQGRRGLLLELQQARERAPRPHQVFGAVQATSDPLDILINSQSDLDAVDRGIPAVAPRGKGSQFARDSALEGDGFELSVPRQRLHGRDQFEPPDPHQEVASDSLLPSVKAPAVCRAYHQILRGQSSRHKKSGPS